ncbi:MAG TPA: osmotically inducible protein C [Eubacteriaceae bacterium]|nr:osmotically inducible protein C [Eubacteriaceae bacterium]
MKDLTFGIKATSENSTKTVVKARNFTMVIDEPKNMGGTDDGANPVEYLIGALAGCMNVVCHLVAKEMGFTLRSVSIDIEGDLNPMKFMGKSDEDRTGYKIIRVTIDADTDADQETLNQWIKEVEKRCPVSDNLQNPTPIEISLK